VVLGLFIAGLVVLLFEYSDDRLRSRDDILASAGLPTLAVIGRSRNVRRLRAGESTTLEDYRELRASVRKLSDEFGLRSILIAGYGRGNGRTMTALNLSLVLADIGESVILVDADFRQPSLHNLTGTPNDFGLSDLLKRAYDPNEWPLFVVDGGIDVLPSGPPPESLSVLSSSNMEELLGELKSTADVVILDSPALSAVSDAFDLARFADGTIIVVESGKTQADNLRTMATMLAERGARVLGVVLNKGRSPRASQRRYRERRNEAGSSAKRGSKPAEEPLRRERGSALPSVIATNGHASNDARSPDSSPAATKGVPALEAEQTHQRATQTVLPADTEPARAPKPRARGSQARPVLPAVNGEQPPN
jgi:capsular exopolysaccharide synthesis family protein